MKINERLERMADVMFSELFQTKTMVITFGILGITCLIGAFWNPWQLMFAAMCGLLVWCVLSELAGTEISFQLQNFKQKKSRKS